MFGSKGFPNTHPPRLAKLSTNENERLTPNSCSTAYLVWADVVASTARGEAPRLQEFHEELLGTGGDGSGLPQLVLEDYVGCQSWAVRLLGEVAALAAWK